MSAQATSSLVTTDPTTLLGDGNVEPQDLTFISHLTHLSLPLLLDEPNNLASEAAVVDTALTTLCHTEYRTFLSLREASSTVAHSFDSFSSSIDALLECIPDLEKTASEFSSAAKAIQSERSKTSLVLEQQEKLLDILEIPQLLDTCVRNGYYQEALDLSTHAEKLAERFPDIAMIKTIQNEVKVATQLMVAQLFNSLRGAAKFKALYRSITFLRRVGALEEVELALAFLACRMAFLNNQLESIVKDQEDSTKRVKRYIDAWREGANDLATQFDAIFLGKSLSSAEPQMRGLLVTALHQLTTDLLHLLEENLPMVEEPTSLTSILTQLAYCSISFSKIGMDFRPLIAPLYEQAVIHTTQSALTNATEEFKTSVLRAQNEPPSKYLISEGIDLKSLEVEKPAGLYLPPQGLAILPPFAHYLNTLITMLNRLRQLAPVASLKTLQESFDKSMATCAEALLGYAENFGSVVCPGLDERLKRDENAKLRYAIDSYRISLVPFVRASLLEGVFGANRDICPLDSALQDVTHRLEFFVNKLPPSVPKEAGDGNDAGTEKKVA